MKKVLLFAASLILAATMFAQGEACCVNPNAKSVKGETKDASWGTFTNFTATDRNGVTHNIQSYLDQGKYVIIDFFCAWCSPCYAYTNRRVLENMYNTYGQGGTGEFVILMVEDDQSNTDAQITGTTSGNNQSAGDFTLGGTNPVPIIDATEHLSSKVSIYDGYVPRVYLFCPSGFVYQVYGVLQETPDAYRNFAMSSCPTDAPEVAKPIVEIKTPAVVKKGVPASFSVDVTSISQVSYAWTFDGGSPASATSASPSTTWNTTGNHTVTLVATNANGSTTETATINVVDCTAGISTFPYTEDFENGQGCWDFISENTENTADYFGVIELNDGSFAAILNSYEQADDYNQYLISPILNHSGELNVTFDYVAAGSTNETFKVKYSTSDNNPSNFTTIGSEITATTSGWATYNGTLPANAKYFMINYTSNYKYYLLIDDITFTAVGGGTQGINDVTASNVKMFPNPTTGNLYIKAEGLQKVEVIDAAGRVVMTETSSSINMSNLANGVYSVRVMANGNSTIQKVVKK